MGTLFGGLISLGYSVLYLGDAFDTTYSRALLCIVIQWFLNLLAVIGLVLMLGGGIFALPFLVSPPPARGGSPAVNVTVVNMGGNVVNR